MDIGYDSGDDVDYILLSKSEYIEAKNFPSQMTCRPEKPQNLPRYELLNPYPTFDEFMKYKE